MKKVLILAGSALILAGCHTDMWVQPKANYQQPNDLFPDGKTARPLVDGTVARGHLKTDSAHYEGRNTDGKLVTDIPTSLVLDGKKVDTTTAEGREVMLKRGQERFEIFCSHCHGVIGDGKGMITQRGLVLRRPPANYNTDRLRKMPIGHFYDVITNGFGAMFSQRSRVESDDRWAIASYIRVLQASQFAPKSTLTPEDMSMLDKKPEPEKTEEEAAH